MGDGTYVMLDADLVPEGAEIGESFRLPVRIVGHNRPLGVTLVETEDGKQLALPSSDCVTKETD
jgi:hypothetical protein